MIHRLIGKEILKFILTVLILNEVKKFKGIYLGDCLRSYIFVIISVSDVGQIINYVWGNRNYAKDGNIA